MWRSIATRASISMRSQSKLRRPPQVLHEIFNSIPDASRGRVNLVSTTFNVHTSRFFSQSPINPSELELDDSHNIEFQSGPLESQQIVDTDAEFEGKGAILDPAFENSDAIMDTLNNLDEEIGNNAIDIEKLEKLLSLLQSTVDQSFESTLDGMNLSLHEEFVVRVLENRLVPWENLIRFFKWIMPKNEFVLTSRVLEVLVYAVSEHNRKEASYEFWDLINEIGKNEENAVLNVEILNSLIFTFSQLGKGKAALEVFNHFEDFGCVPNVKTYYLTLEALQRRSLYDWAWMVCEKMLNAGMLPETVTLDGMISSFCKGKKAKEAHLLYLSAKENGKCPRVDFLIRSLCDVDETVQLARDLLDDLPGERRAYAVHACSKVVHGLCRVKDIDGAKILLFKMIEEGPPPGNSVFNVVISSLSKAGDLDEAMRMLKLMEERGLKPDVYTYSVIMSGYAKGGLMDEACKVLSEAKLKHTKLCPASYHTLIRGYCNIKENDKALNLLKEMEDYGVNPNVDEYNKLIQSLCLQALDWKTAEKLLEEMKGKALHLPDMARGLIRAVRELEEEALNVEIVGA